MIYIKRDDAIGAIVKVATRFCRDVELVANIIHAVESVPAADVRPVKRGHWITEEEAEAKGDYMLKDTCSVCGHCDWDSVESQCFHYCPNCGAWMCNEEEQT